MFIEAIDELETTAALHLQKAEKEIEWPKDKEWNLERSKELKDAADFLKVAQFGGVTALVQAVRDWGTERNIIGINARATAHTQFDKLIEEVEEVRVGLEKKDQGEIVDGIGDCTVVLILLAELVGVRFESCLLAAYEEIKNRKGKMVNGTFVKES
jgi:NTP pyrophosphatase (non-canonical NTP hydrolase)